MLQVVDKIRPRGSYQWDQVEDDYNRARPLRSIARDKESIRTKFKSLKNAKKPTGDATCPEPVRIAKTIAKEIEREASVFKMGSDDEEEGSDSVASSSSSSSDSGSDDNSFPTSPIRSPQFQRRSPQFQRSPTPSPRRYGSGVIEETIAPAVVPESMIERISIDSDREENAPDISDEIAPDISDAQKTSQLQLLREINDLQKPSQLLRASSHPAPAKKRASKESLRKEVASSYVPDRLGKSASELMAMKNSKQPALVPQHPLHSKKRSILKELKDVDEAEAQAKQDSAHQILGMHRSQEMQFQEKMMRLEMKFEEDRRRWEEEKEIKKEERRAQQAKMDADQRQQALLFHSALAVISALTGNPAVTGVVNAIGSVLAPSAMPPAPPRD